MGHGNGINEISDGVRERSTQISYDALGGGLLNSSEYRHMGGGGLAKSSYYNYSG